MTETILSMDRVSSFYGNIQALKNVSLKVFHGEIVTLIGANGAGKSTCLMTICGQPEAQSGRIEFKGKNICGLRSDEIAHLGVAHVPEGRRIFSGLTVQENLQMGLMATSSRVNPQKIKGVFELFPGLADRRHQRGGTLSGGEQQMLAIGRALMADPELLLMDEPSLGLAPLIVKQIFEIIKMLQAERKMTILLVEQNAHYALRLADRGYVLVNGQVEFEGSGEALLEDKNVQTAYLEGKPSSEN